MSASQPGPAEQAELNERALSVAYHNLREERRRASELEEENARLCEALRMLGLQKYGLTHAWACCDWRKCEKHGTYARGGNWGAIEGKDGAVCPWCHAAELLSPTQHDEKASE